MFLVVGLLLSRAQRLEPHRVGRLGRGTRRVGRRVLDQRGGTNGHQDASERLMWGLRFRAARRVAR